MAAWLEFKGHGLLITPGRAKDDRDDQRQHHHAMNSFGPARMVRKKIRPAMQHNPALRRYMQDHPAGLHWMAPLLSDKLEKNNRDLLHAQTCRGAA